MNSPTDALVDWGNRVLQEYPGLKLFVLPMTEYHTMIGHWSSGALTKDCGLSIKVSKKRGYDVTLCGVKVMFTDKLPKNRTLFRVK